MAAAKGKKKSSKKKKSARKPLLSTKVRVSIRILAGLAFAVAAGLLAAALISYAFTWSADYSIKTDPEFWTRHTVSHNICGKSGFVFADAMVSKWFGLGAFCVPVFLASIALYLFRLRNTRPVRNFFLCITGCIIISAVSAFLSTFLPEQILFATGAGGSYGYYANEWLTGMLGKLGTGALLFFVLLVWLMLLSRKVVAFIDVMLFRLSHKPRKEKKSGESDEIEIDEAELGEDESEELLEMEEPVLFETEEDLPDNGETEDNDAIDIDIEPDPAPAVGGDGVPMIVEEGGMDPTANLESDGLEHLYNPRLDLSNYKFPPVQLLADYSDMWFEISMDEMERNKERIVRTLASYKIKVEKISAKKGPTVTLYRIHLAEGIRIAKVKVLEEDIAMSMGAKGVRVITLPDSIGIEVANEKASVVPLKMVLNSPQFLEKSAKMELPVAMGITVTNEPFFFDLAKMPHLLVAGATGMGKSVGLNAIVTSLLYTKHPAEMKFVMVDPKQVELDFYRKLEKHYLATLPDAEEAIITDTTKVIHTLKSLCVEMESRYTLLREAGVRKITEYNQKFLARRLNPVNGHKFLPYIVVILDEFADLICTAGREIEEPIARLAQKARAVGIHLVIATQRPTTDVITGTIKANFNSRIAFKVNASVDSKTIIDQSGAQHLIGRGDMLAIYPGSEMVRVQCALIETEEVDKVTEFIGEQRGYEHSYFLPEYEDESSASDSDATNLSRRDGMFDEAAKMVVQTQQGSTSLIQRKLGLGYNRAGRIMDQLEAAGIVGPSVGSKAREVLVKDFDTLDRILDALDRQ